jgi:hypothetical protein
LGGGGIEEFQWSTSEQVWPFEKSVDGETIYCKEIDFGALPNNGTKSVSHNINLTSPNQVINQSALAYSPAGDVNPIVYVSTAGITFQIQWNVNLTSVWVRTAANWSSNTSRVRIWYIKD